MYGFSALDIAPADFLYDLTSCLFIDAHFYHLLSDFVVEGAKYINYHILFPTSWRIFGIIRGVGIADMVGEFGLNLPK